MIANVVSAFTCPLEDSVILFEFSERVLLQLHPDRGDGNDADCIRLKIKRSIQFMISPDTPAPSPSYT